ncbi:MBL fold metallo-hydrolase [Luedemannella flava]
MGDPRRAGPLPPAVGLGEPGPLPRAVIITHGHQDHWGLVPNYPTACRYGSARPPPTSCAPPSSGEPASTYASKAISTTSRR